MGNEKTVEIQYEGNPEPIVPLDDVAEKMWNHLQSALPKRVLAQADSASLTIMCEMWSMILQKREDYKISNKWTDFSAMSAALKHFNGLADRFGLNPVARTKITPKGTGKEGAGEMLDDLMKDLLARN